VILAAFARATGKAALHRAAALAYLRASGAIVCADPDVWLEVIALLAGYGLPAGPRVAIVAPDGSWLAASAATLANEAAALGTRFPEVTASAVEGAAAPDGDDGDGGAVDVVLADRAMIHPRTPTRIGRALIVPAVARAELLVDDGAVALVGLRAALGAITAAGRSAQRCRAGLGAEPVHGGGGVDGDNADGDGDGDGDAVIRGDLDRFRRQIEKLGQRAGDHEAKVLLSCYDIPVTRQAVATTPSAATRVAKKAGYPVEVKPWGPDLPSEDDGCPVVRGIETAAQVRRAAARVAKRAGLPIGHPVIVRETPPAGRAVAARVAPIGALGWMVVVQIPGVPDPLAAPAPLRPIDAAALAARLESTRAGDAAPDRDALADVLRRASHLAVRHADVIAALDLHRIVVAADGDGAVVVDASIDLHTPRA
jgi:hypothetical protein